MKSKTLVIHLNDPSTEFLKKIYEDKGYDVINNPYTSKSAIKWAIKTHKRIIMMGHGTPYGLINPVAWNGNSKKKVEPYIIDDTFADLLRKKNTISIWCNSDIFYKRNNLHDGNLHTGMIISETSEQHFVLGKVYLNEQEQLENMNRFAEVVHDCIELPGEEKKGYILAHYTGDDEVTKYNRERVVVI